MSKWALKFDTTESIEYDGSVRNGKKKHPFSPDVFEIHGFDAIRIPIDSKTVYDGCALRPFFYGFMKGRYSIINNRKVVPNNVNDDLYNEKIPFREVLVIDANGKQLGVKSRNEALDIAYRQNLDLLCVAPKARPAVCKVLNYGKYHFEQQKKEKEAKRKQHTVELKSLRLSPVVDTHDFETKLRQVRKWIEQGMKVKIDMRFRGRMMTRQDVGRQIMNDFLEQVKDIAVVEKKPSLEGNVMSIVLAPQKKKQAPAPDKN